MQGVSEGCPGASSGTAGSHDATGKGTMLRSALDFIGMKKTYRTRGCDYNQWLIRRRSDPSWALVVSPALTLTSPRGGMCPQGTAEFGPRETELQPTSLFPDASGLQEDIYLAIEEKRSILFANRRKKIS